MLCNCDKGLLAITKLPRTHWMVVIHVTVTSVVSVIGVITQYMSQVWCQKQVSQAGIRNCVPQKCCEIKYMNIYIILWDTISYPLFADARMGIYPNAASQYHARPKARPNIVTFRLFSSKPSNHDRRPAAIGVWVQSLTNVWTFLITLQNHITLGRGISWAYEICLYLYM